MRKREKFELDELARCLDMILLRFYHDAKKFTEGESYELDVQIHEWLSENIDFTKQ